MRVDLVFVVVEEARASLDALGRILLRSSLHVGREILLIVEEVSREEQPGEDLVDEPALADHAVVPGPPYVPVDRREERLIPREGRVPVRARLLGFQEG